ncbi:MAG: peptide ABC transporter substrate-binding protein [Caldilineae bacterium]|nr:peptide ABC transporter substrate-binding protein [Chloroflexota bacterium]MCB9176452.1 peptide ABC transporter substrate-binding protein [Caldilineae bacterium]
MLTQLRWQIALALAGVLVIGAILFFVSDRAFVDRPARGGQYVEAVIGAPATYNPLLARTDAEVSLTRLMFSGLTRPAPGAGMPQPDLAERWRISPDGRIYTFFLRPGATWHDGEPVTADDVLFTVALAQDPAIPDAQKTRLAEPWQGTTLRKVDDQTVEVVLPEPFAPFLSAAMLPILPEHLLAGQAPGEIAGSRFSKFAPVGSGPYKLVTTGDIPPDADRLQRYEGHWSNQDGRPYLDTIELRYFPSPEAAVEAVGRREAQGMGRVPPAALTQLGDEVSIYSAVQSGYMLIYLNPSNPLLVNASVRQALSLALDRRALIAAEDLLDGQGLLATSPIPAGSWAFDADIPEPTYSPEQAATELDQAGWLDSDGDGWRDRDGQLLSIPLSTPGDNPLLVAMADRVAEGWTRIGISVTVQALSPQNLATTVNNRAFTALLYSLELPFYDPDPYALWHSSQVAAPGINYAGYANPEVDRLLAEARRMNPETDLAERQARYAEFQRIFAQDLPALMIAYPVYTYVVSDAAVGGIQMPPLVVEPADRFQTLARWFTQTERVFREDSSPAP